MAHIAVAKNFALFTRWLTLLTTIKIAFRKLTSGVQIIFAG